MKRTLVETRNGSSLYDRISVGLDIGSSKVCCVVASKKRDSTEITILGYGIAERKRAKGRFGRIDNIDELVKDISIAIEQAEHQSNFEIKKVNVGINGEWIKFKECRGLVTISSPDRVITKKDVQRVLENSKLQDDARDVYILDMIPQEYRINDELVKSNPVGMVGSKLEVTATMITAPRIEIENVIRCLERNSLEYDHIVYEPIATSLAIFSDEELEPRYALIDIGDLKTDISIFENGTIKSSAVIFYGGRHITQNLGALLSISFSQAENLKKEYGRCFVNESFRDREIMINPTRGHKPYNVQLSQITHYISESLSYILGLSRDILFKLVGKNRSPISIVLTGGTSMIEGIENLASEIFGTQVRIGAPINLDTAGLVHEVNKPFFSTAVGLAIYGLQKDSELVGPPESTEEASQQEKQGIISKIINFFKNI